MANFDDLSFTLSLFFFSFLSFIDNNKNKELIKNDTGHPPRSINQQKIISLSLARVFLLAPLNIDYEKVLRSSRRQVSFLNVRKKMKRYPTGCQKMQIHECLKSKIKRCIYAIFFATRYSKTGIAAESESMASIIVYIYKCVILHK